MFYNHGQNIVDKCTKLSKIGVSLDCFTADFSNFLAYLWKFGFFGWGLAINSKLFRDFLEISLFPVRQFVRQLVHSSFGNNNLVLILCDCLKTFFLVFTSLKMRANSNNDHSLVGKSNLTF